jgi:4-hydroxybenzoyl-CoA thioesterase
MRTPHLHTVRVQWGHNDPAGIVFYPHFFAYFDEATWSMFHGVGLTLEVMRERYNCIGIPLVDAQASFKSPCRFRDVLTIESAVTDVKEKTFTVEHRLRNGDREAVTGREVRIWGSVHPDDPQRLKANPLPPEVLKALGV